MPSRKRSGPSTSCSSSGAVRQVASGKSYGHNDLPIKKDKKEEKTRRRTVPFLFYFVTCQIFI